jgi:hypothetical protein
MSNVTLFEKVEDKIQSQLKKSLIAFLEDKFTVTFKGSMPTPRECNQFSRQSLAHEFYQFQHGVMELCREHYQTDECEELLQMYVDLLFPLVYYKTYASKHMDWSNLKRYYQGIRMFNGMDYLFLENYDHEEELMREMKCHPVEGNYEEATDDEMLELCRLCNVHDYYLNNSELLDALIVRALIKELKEGRIPQERLHGMYPATMFLEPVPEESEYIFYVD